MKTKEVEALIKCLNENAEDIDGDIDIGDCKINESIVISDWSLDAELFKLTRIDLDNWEINNIY